LDYNSLVDNKISISWRLDERALVAYWCWPYWLSLHADDGEDRLATSSIETWRNILQTPELTDNFRGSFNHLGIEVEETGERFTIHHQGSQFTFEEGISEESVDLIVPVKIQNINNMAAR